MRLHKPSFLFCGRAVYRPGARRGPLCREKLRDRHKTVSPLLQGIYNPEGRSYRRVKRVVHQNNIAGLYGAQHRSDVALCISTLPVLGIHRPAYQRNAEEPPLPLAQQAVGRTYPVLPVTQQAAQRSVCPVDLSLYDGSRRRRPGGTPVRVTRV
jgi:hypothetical protein